MVTVGVNTVSRATNTKCWRCWINRCTEHLNEAALLLTCSLLHVLLLWLVNLPAVCVQWNFRSFAQVRETHSWPCVSVLPSVSLQFSICCFSWSVLFIPPFLLTFSQVCGWLWLFVSFALHLYLLSESITCNRSCPDSPRGSWTVDVHPLSGGVYYLHQCVLMEQLLLMELQDADGWCCSF